MQYDASAKTLIITFVSRTIYRYKNVPVSVYKRMSAATSKGMFLNTFVKGKYEYEKVEKS